MNQRSSASAALCAIGIDVGGTKTAAGIVDLCGRVLTKRVRATAPTRGGQAVLQDVLALAEDLREEARRRDWQVAALGLGVCELVDPDGRVLSGQTIAWRGLPVREQLAKLAPAIVEADSRAAAFCEARCGAGQPFRSFLYVTVGTGIGSSIVQDGLPWTGTRGATGTLATAPMTVWCAHCARPASAVLEEIASGPALVNRYRQQTISRVESAEEVLAAAQAGDPIARSVIETAALTLGATIALLVNVLDPEAVVVGGGLGAAPGMYWERLAPSIRSHIWSDVHRNLPLLQSAQGGDAGMIGAALAGLRSLENRRPS